DNRRQPTLLQHSYKLGDLLAATKEPIRIGFRHRFETDEWTVERDRLFARRSAQHSAQKLRKRFWIVERVVDPLELPRKGRECRGPRAFLGEDRDEGIIRCAGRARKPQPNLAFDPVDDAFAADM